jgi:2C-methyl-D-erythritol 2,4-cyclodiphosphate synthase
LRTDEDYEGVVQDEMLKDALDLINRQKAEIEEQDQAIINALRRMGEIRAEAIKEFSDRLKERLIKGGIYPVLVKNSINDLVKEMTGERR